MNTSQQSFFRLHPLVPGFMFGFEIVLSVVSFQPVCAFILLLGAFVSSVALFGFGSAARRLSWYVPVVLFMTILNPVFSASGSTYLFKVGQNVIYLESLVYGATSGMVFVGTLCWLECFFAVLSPLEFLQKSSVRFPAMQLVLTLAARFMPQLLGDFATTQDAYNANTARVEVVSQTGRLRGLLKPFSMVRMKLQQATTSFNAVVMSAFEKSIITSQSIVARGWGLFHKRTRWDIEVIDTYEMVVILLCLFMGIFAVIALFIVKNEWQFYPTMPSAHFSLWYIGIFFYAFIPSLFMKVDAYLWERDV